MWFDWDGSRIRMTHKSTRQKVKNFAHEPRVALSIADPEDPNRYIEVRGVVESIEPDDAEASFYQSLQVRYDDVYEINDAPERVVVTIRPESYVIVVGGSVVRAR